jgi:hypothetical protein
VGWVGKIGGIADIAVIGTTKAGQKMHAYARDLAGASPVAGGLNCFMTAPGPRSETEQPGNSIVLTY